MTLYYTFPLVRQLVKSLANIRPKQLTDAMMHA